MAGAVVIAGAGADRRRRWPDTQPGRWRCRSRRCGSPRRRSRAGPAARRRRPAGCRCPTRDASILRLTARRTWRFFETFVTAADNMLPPDNFQEDPAPVLAHRTSPTNIGLYLLSTVSARDFGWIGTDRGGRAAGGDARDHGRARSASAAISSTGTTRAICGRSIRRYISSVDSGNLAGHLIALANACREWRDHPVADAPAPRRHRRRHRADARGGEPAARRAPHADGDLAPARRCARRARRRCAAAPGDGEDIAQRLGALCGRRRDLADIARAFAIERGDDIGADMLFWAEAARAAIESHRDDLACSADAARRAGGAPRRRSRTPRARLALAMEFGFLLDRDRRLLSIGYRVAGGSLDPSCYDLLASEARLASFVAIAKGDVPARHWFRLGRAVTPIAHGAALISWSGSMFEYLMPSLVMRAPAGSLHRADQPADRAAADRLRGDARRALGRFGIRLQRPRPGIHLPIFELRRARPRPQARPGREHRHRALRHRARRHGRSAGRGAQLRAPGGGRRARPLWLLRGAGLHADPAAGRQDAWRSCAPSWRIIRA